MSAGPGRVLSTCYSAALMALTLGWTDTFAGNQSVTFRPVKILADKMAVRNVIKTVPRTL